jgi:MarR family transcriptional regulator for hemolysin
MTYLPKHSELGTELYITTRTYSRVFDKYARENGLNRTRWTILWILKKRPGLKQNELADILESAPITLSRQIDKLEHEGLVERVKDEHDRRCQRLYLCESAQPIVKTLQALSDKLREKALAGISDQDIDRFMTILNTIKTNISDGEF